MTDPTPDTRHLQLVRHRDPAPAELEPYDEHDLDLYDPTELEPATRREIEPAVVEGEIVDEQDSSTVSRRPIPVWSRRLPAPVQRAASSRTAEHAVIVAAGFASWTGRAADGATLGTYRRAIRAAEATGDRAALAEWTGRRQEVAARRHERWLKLPHLAAAALGAAVIALLGGLLLLVLIAGAAQLSGVGSFLGVLHGAAQLVGVLLWAAGFAFATALIGGPVIVVVLAHREGKRTGHTPSWIATAEYDDTGGDMEIDETTIAEALKALRIPQVTDYFKAGNLLQVLVLPRREGRGTYVMLRLPLGVTAEMVAGRRAQLAAGLYRQAKEVWPTTGGEAGILALWIADKGILAEGAGPYPLLDDGLVDVFKGVPFGKTLRGDPIVAPVMERNTITGGMPGQGKSSSARIIMAGAALDPTAELRIYVPDSNFDFDVFARRCSRYIRGDEDEQIEAILHDLQQLYAEVQQRGRLLISEENPAVTRALASAGIGLHPLFVLIEEAHLLIQHKDYGKEFAQLLVDIVRLGRKRGIHVIVSTQAPTKDSMPRQVTRNCSNGVAFAVGDYVANDALLGQGAYKAGHRATDLIPGTDVGTAVCKGFIDEARSAIVQTYFLDVGKGRDQVSPIIARSLAAIERAGQPVPSSVPLEQRDLLADVAAVLDDDEPIPAAEVPPRLRRLAPAWPPYRRLTGISLRAVLDEEYGYRVPSTANRWPVDPAAIRAILADREAMSE